jgi:hypothetical protein
MKHPLDDCQTKLARADQLYGELLTEIEQWRAPGGARIEAEYRPKRREYVYIARVVPPPLRWGAIFGDCLHNLRSSLDTLMWQLVVLRGGRPSRRTQFPIFERRAAYRTHASAMIEGVSRRDRGILERLQPFYHSRGGMPPGGHPLAQLVRLSNIDKHRLIHAATTGLGLFDDDGPRVVEGIPNGDAGQILKTTWRRDIDLHDGDEIVRFRLAPTGSGPIVTINRQLGVGIGFGEWASVSSLLYIREGIDRVLEVFHPEFDAVGENDRDKRTSGGQSRP